MQLVMRRFDIRSRAHAGGLHLLVSTLVAAAAAALVFGLWYPGPYQRLAGGRGLFWLVVSVDVVLGPLLTFSVFNVAKGRHLYNDLACIGVLQLAALVYGLYTVYWARPVALVFEADRFRVIAAADVPLQELPKAPAAYRHLPLTGPWQLAARIAQHGDERNDALFMGLNGVDVGQRPLFWRPYTEYRAAAIGRSRSVDLLLNRYPARAAELAAILDELRLDVGKARFLPVVARGDWVAILDMNGDVAGYAAFDGFF
jgi:hypothetical protein